MAQTLTLANLKKAMEQNNSTLKEWINTQLANMSTFNIVWVEKLPTEDISTSTIYMLKNTESTDENNIYDEYVYNETSGWEVIGSLNTGSVDLSEYYNKTETYSKEEIDNLLANFKSVTISSAENNAVVENEDGLFVEDKTSEIENLTTRVDEIKRYQKYVNADLEYLHLSEHTTTSAVAVTADTNILSLLTTKNGTITLDEESYVLLSKGKKYLLNTSCLTKFDNDSTIFSVKDKNGNQIGNLAYTVNITNTSINNSIQPVISGIVEPAEDIYVGLFVNEDVSVHVAYSYFNVHEIGRQITIDPLEYVNESQGIEDTPVGSMINYLGKTPKHYLLCDGSEYNISDYPYLAQYIKDAYGSINYFGGDGKSTFAIPKNNNLTIEKIATVDGEAFGSTYYKTYVAKNLFDNSASTIWCTAENQHINHYAGYNFLSLQTIIAYSVTISSFNENDINCAPKSFRLQGSLDGELWEDLDTQINVKWTESGQTKTFYLNNSVEYSQYRIYIDANNGSIKQTFIGGLAFYKEVITAKNYIKYEPTYFMNIHGMRTETVLFEGSFATDTVTLSESIESYDQLEIYVGTIPNPQIITTKEIIYAQQYNCIALYISSGDYDGLRIMFHFNDPITITIDHNPHKRTITKIKGIKYYTENGTSNGSTTTEEYLEEDVTNAINELW